MPGWYSTDALSSPDRVYGDTLDLLLGPRVSGSFGVVASMRRPRPSAKGGAASPCQTQGAAGMGGGGSTDYLVPSIYSFGGSSVTRLPDWRRTILAIARRARFASFLSTSLGKTFSSTMRAITDSELPGLRKWACEFLRRASSW